MADASATRRPIREIQLEGDIPWEGRSPLMQWISRQVNRLFFRACGGRNRPVFFDIDQTYPSLRILDRNADVIREELLRVLPRSDGLPDYSDLDAAQTEIASGGTGHWKIFVLYAMGNRPERNRELCPRTSALLDQIPNLFQANFSILEPGKSIPPHRTGWMGYLRYHLALQVPRTKPPTIRVRDQYYTWQEGESVLFDDSWEHEVYNESDEKRAVLLVDVLRPMPGFAHAVNKLLTLGARFLYGASLTRKAEQYG